MPRRLLITYFINSKVTPRTVTDFATQSQPQRTNYTGGLEQRRLDEFQNKLQHDSDQSDHGRGELDEFFAHGVEMKKPAQGGQQKSRRIVGLAEGGRNFPPTEKV